MNEDTITNHLRRVVFGMVTICIIIAIFTVMYISVYVLLEFGVWSAYILIVLIVSYFFGWLIDTA